MCAGDMSHSWQRILVLCALLTDLSEASRITWPSEQHMDNAMAKGSDESSSEQLHETEGRRVQWRDSEHGQPLATEPSQVFSVYFHDMEKRLEGDYQPTGNYTGEDGEEGEGTEVSELGDNCTRPQQPHDPLYNDSCAFVHAECEDKAELFDYLAFVLCDLPKAQVRRDGREWGEGGGGGRGEGIKRRGSRGEGRGKIGGRGEGRGEGRGGGREGN